MKIKFSNVVKLFLAGACFAAVGCTDYGQDIENLNNRIDALETDTIDPLKADLEATKNTLAAAQKAIEDQKAKHDADVAALQKADADLQAAVNAAAQKAAADLAALSKSMQDADAALAKDLAALSKTLADQIAAVDAKANENAADIDKVETDVAKNAAAIAALTAAHDAAVKQLGDAIAAGDAKNAQAIVDLDAKLTKAIEDYVAGLNKDIEDLNNEIKDLNSTDENLQEQIDALVVALENTNKEVAENAKNITALQENLAKAIDESIARDEKIEDAMKAMEETFNAAIDALNETTKALRQDLNDHIAAYTLFKGEVEGRLATLEQQVVALQAKDVEIEGLIEALDVRLKANEELAAQNAADIKANKELFDEFVKATSQTLKELLAADAALVTNLNDLKADLMKHKDEIRAELDKHYGDFAVYQSEVASEFELVKADIATNAAAIKANAESIAANKALIDALTADLAAKYDELNTKISTLDTKYQTITNALDTRLTSLEDAHNKLQAAHDKLAEDFDAYQTKTDAALASIEAEQLEQDGKIKLNADQIADIQTALTSLQTKVNDNFDTLNNTIEGVKTALETQISELNKGLDALKGRIQSLVFVPEYTDGKATIKWAQLDNALVEGQSVLKFQVFPANCASAITKDDLTFLFSDELKARRQSGDEQEPALEVVGVKVLNAKKGIVGISVNARNLGQSFYDGDTNYAVSLVLETELVNIASCYVNLIPAAADKIDVELVNATATEYTIEYVDTTSTRDILPNHKYQFSINGEGAYTIEGMLGMGYVITVEKGAPTFEFNAPANQPDVFKTVVDESKPYLNLVTVSLAEAKHEAVGGVKTVTYHYNVCGKDLTASSTVRVVKIQRAISMTGADIVWNYADDAKSDANLEFTNSVDVATITASTLPEDITYEMLLNVTPTVTVSVDGAVATDVTAKFAGTNAAPTISLTNFDWGKTYTVVAVYELASIDVTITATVNTVDRVRDAVTIDLDKVAGDPAQWILTKDFVNQSETAADSLNALYEKLVENKVNTTLNAADFLYDIFKNNAYVVVENVITVNDETTAVTKDHTNLVIAENGASIKSVYNVTEFEVVPKKINYSYTVTTWYGQEITFVKTLNIGLEPVEITLKPEPKNLVKDLVFTTTPEALAEIHTKVAHVDASFTDDEYLTAIFVTNALRDKIETAHGIVLIDPDKDSGTKVSVAADGLTASASYSYENLAVTPKTVEYESNYTTWYGQEITIKKVVTIDDTTYNYVYVPEFVYNDANGYYSNAKAYRVNNPATSSFLEDVSIKLDMNTAFNVVDKDDNVIAVADLAALGLASTFDFTTTHHAGIFFQEGSNWLIYHGHDLKVGVNGQLVLTNSNGVETVLPTNFDGEYADYFVNQYNPVGKLKSSNLDIKVSKIAKDYTYFINNQLKLVDDRGKNLIKRGTEYVDETEVTWTPADWVVGDNENGFADGVNVANIYGLKFNEGAYTLITPIPASLNGALSFTAATGELYFKNTNQIELTEQITLKFNVKIEHKWGYDSTEFTVTLVPEK